MNFPYLIPRMNIPYHTLAKERPNLCVEGNCHFKETPPTRNGITSEWAGGPYLCEFGERYTKLILAPWAPARVPDRALTPNSDPQMRPFLSHSRQMKSVRTVSSPAVSQTSMSPTCSRIWFESLLNGPRSTRLSHEIIYRYHRNSGTTANQRPEAP